jgi:hypothetical protein
MGQLKRSILISYSKKKHKSGHENRRGIILGGQHPRYDGTDAVNYHRVTTYEGDERRWNECDKTKELCVTR